MHVGIIEHERNLHAMRAAQSSAENRRFPCEHVHIHRCAALFGLQIGLPNCSRTEFCIKIDNILGLEAWISFAIGLDYFIGSFSIDTLGECTCHIHIGRAQLRYVGRRRELAAGGTYH